MSFSGAPPQTEPEAESFCDINDLCRDLDDVNIDNPSNNALTSVANNVNSDLIKLEVVKCKDDLTHQQNSNAWTKNQSWTHVKVIPQQGCENAKTPIHLLFVVDVSGSMQSAVEKVGADGKRESNGFSVLDLVKHSLLTIVESLGQPTPSPTYFITLISFTDTATVHFTGLCCDTKENREKAMKTIKDLRPQCSTNMWAGLQKAYDVVKQCETYLCDGNGEFLSQAESIQLVGGQAGTDSITSGVAPAANQPASYNHASNLARLRLYTSALRKVASHQILVFTDGMPNVVPPRGHIASMKRYVLNNQIPQNHCVRTYGFGYNGLDCDLLERMASVGVGGTGGSFSFIPDASFVGTVFIHSVASILSSVALGGCMKLKLNGLDIENKKHRILGFGENCDKINEESTNTSNTGGFGNNQKEADIDPALKYMDNGCAVLSIGGSIELGQTRNFLIRGDPDDLEITIEYQDLRSLRGQAVGANSDPVNLKAENETYLKTSELSADVDNNESQKKNSIEAIAALSESIRLSLVELLRSDTVRKGAGEASTNLVNNFIKTMQMGAESNMSKRTSDSPSKEYASDDSNSTKSSTSSSVENSPNSSKDNRNIKGAAAAKIQNAFQNKFAPGNRKPSKTSGLKACAGQIIGSNYENQFAPLTLINSLGGQKLLLPLLLQNKSNSDLTCLHGYILALIKDLAGEVLLALEAKDSYKKWGNPYLRSLAYAHFIQTRNNFKDHGVLHYNKSTNGMFDRQVERISDVFDQLAPPEPSARNYSRGNYVAVTSMAHYNNAYGGCFTGDTYVTLANGSSCRVDRLKKGSWVLSGRKLVPVKVKCVIKTVADKEGLLKVIKLRTSSSLTGSSEDNFVGITPWHPVYYDSDRGSPNDSLAQISSNAVTDHLETPEPIDQLERLKSDDLLFDTTNFEKSNPIKREWYFPAQFATEYNEKENVCNHQNLFAGESDTYTEVYNLLLEGEESDHTIIVSGCGTGPGLIACTLGHGIKENKVIEHEYYGSYQKMVNDFSQLPGWKNGLVHLYVNAKNEDRNILAATTIRNAESGLVEGVTKQAATTIRNAESGLVEGVTNIVSKRQESMDTSFTSASICSSEEEETEEESVEDRHQSILPELPGLFSSPSKKKHSPSAAIAATLLRVPTPNKACIEGKHLLHRTRSDQSCGSSIRERSETGLNRISSETNRFVM